MTGIVGLCWFLVGWVGRMFGFIFWLDVMWVFDDVCLCLGIVYVDGLLCVSGWIVYRFSFICLDACLIIVLLLLDS